MAGVSDDIAALDFDLTCAFRLEIHDRQCREAQAKLIAIEVSKIFSKPEDGDR